MKKYLPFIAIAILFSFIGYAVAQSTAQQTVIGTQSIVNGFAKWAPISTSNPLPVISQ